MLDITYRWCSEVVGCLHRKGFLQITPRSGQSNIYHPILPWEPRNHNSGVDPPNPGTTVQGSGDTPEPQFLPPRNYNSGDPGTTVPTEIDKEKQIKEVEHQPLADTAPSASTETAVETQKLQKTSKRQPIKDTVQLEKILAAINLEPFRRKWEPMGLDIDDTWENFHDYVLTGSGKKPGPNPSNWRNFENAFRDSCKRQYKRNQTSGAQHQAGQIRQPYGETPDSPTQAAYRKLQ